MFYMEFLYDGYLINCAIDFFLYLCAVLDNWKQFRELYIFLLCQGNKKVIIVKVNAKGQIFVLVSYTQGIWDLSSEMFTRIIDSS